MNLTENSINDNTLIEYLNSKKNIKDELLYLVDSNIVTYNMDLEEISIENIELSGWIQQNFVSKYERLNELFGTYTINIIGRKLAISFYNTAVRLPLRKICSKMMGDLVSFHGIVTRSSQVRPELSIGVFKCKECGTKSEKIKQYHRFCEPIFCGNDICTNRTKFEVDINESIFINWQRINVQEDTEEMPEGSVPRMIEVILRDYMVETVSPGQLIQFTGYCMAIPTNGPGVREAPIHEGIVNEKKRRISKDLSFKYVFFAIHTNSIKSKEGLNENEIEIINQMQNHPRLYEGLYESLFPTIYGHSNIKAAILLLAIGGVAKDIGGMKVRGDINLLLVGDPGTAKSQFLKNTAALLPRAVFTSGKSSTAAGLTAAVVKDGETGEFTIEAGALMLADNGICCIDEFDKMSYKDQVSIHEAMEQQTITIAKAGINASLNSRTSILAAANPIRGRYDKRHTLKQNINLSAPIMSRFDLYFVLIDEICEEQDLKISKAILNNHIESGLNKSNDLEFDLNNCNKINNIMENSFKLKNKINKNMPFTTEEVILYIKYIKDRKPIISNESIILLQNKYVSLRQDSLINTSNYKMTARHLESMIRLSEALAKLHNDSIVGISHIEEAYRLIQSSVIEICGDDINLICKEVNDNFLISSKDYSRIMNCLVYLLKLHKLSKDELILKYLELIEETMGSIQQLEIERTKCNRTISYLIENEGVFYEIDGFIYIHPDYDN